MAKLTKAQIQAAVALSFWVGVHRELEEKYHAALCMDKQNTDLVATLRFDRYISNNALFDQLDILGIGERDLVGGWMTGSYLIPSRRMPRPDEPTNRVRYKG